MNNIIEQKKIDTLIANEAGVSQICRTIGYDSLGDPIELVFDIKDQTYAWHVGGEYKHDASDSLTLLSLQRLLPSLQ